MALLWEALCTHLMVLCGDIFAAASSLLWHCIS
jgi:hypothetical protein